MFPCTTIVGPGLGYRDTEIGRENPEAAVFV